MRIIVCGGRDFIDAPLLWKALDRFSMQNVVDLVIDGASDDVTGPYMGADYWAHQWATARGFKSARVHAEWKRLGKIAGPVRNLKMIEDYYPQHVIAFAGGRGTQNMIDQARKHQIEVTEIGK